MSIDRGQEREILLDLYKQTIEAIPFSQTVEQVDHLRNYMANYLVQARTLGFITEQVYTNLYKEVTSLGGRVSKALSERDRKREKRLEAKIKGGNVE